LVGWLVGWLVDYGRARRPVVYSWKLPYSARVTWRQSPRGESTAPQLPRGGAAPARGSAAYGSSPARWHQAGAVRTGKEGRAGRLRAGASRGLAGSRAEQGEGGERGERRRAEEPGVHCEDEGHERSDQQQRGVLVGEGEPADESARVRGPAPPFDAEVGRKEEQRRAEQVVEREDLVLYAEAPHERRECKCRRCQQTLPLPAAHARRSTAEQHCRTGGQHAAEKREARSRSSGGLWCHTQPGAS